MILSIFRDCTRSDSEKEENWKKAKKYFFADISKRQLFFYYEVLEIP